MNYCGDVNTGNILVLANTFSQDGLPRYTNRAPEVIKVLLKDITPRSGVPVRVYLDRGPHFITEIVQNLPRIVLKCNHHALMRPQSSSNVERMNQSLKSHISKTCQESKLKWPDALPLALLRIRMRSTSKEKISLVY